MRAIFGASVGSGKSSRRMSGMPSERAFTAASAASSSAISADVTRCTQSVFFAMSAAVQAGLGDIPFVGPDGINDGGVDTKDSYLNLAGDNAKNSYSTLAGIGDFPAKAQFNADYKAEFGTDPTGYASTGYACTQVILDAIKRAVAGGADVADKAALREAIRKAAVDTTVKYSTILGDVSFDANGDTTQKIISIYAYDATGANGKGDWAFKEQIDYAK